MIALSPAEKLLQDLGVTEPSEIDLEAIAYFVNAEVRYRDLDGCEARILGTGDRAIISVNRRSSRSRQRFSIAHELGHWHHHRGRHLACRVEEDAPIVGAPPSERTADGYAADLLMPAYLFGPLSRQQRRTDFAAVRALADAFAASLTATAIRLVESDHWPLMLVCHGPEGRKWFTRSPSVPDRWFPREDIDHDSHAFDVQFGNEADIPMLRKVGAEAWFDRGEARLYELKEQTIRIPFGQTLTLLNFDDDEMLEEQSNQPRW